MVLDDPLAELRVATEAQSELRRLEQQVRWSRMKADASARAPAEQADGASIDARKSTVADAGSASPEARSERVPPSEVSRLLLLRSTRTTRAVVAQYADLLAVAYPARHVDLVLSLTSEAPWPGAGIVWCHVVGTDARILERPPRGVTLGR